MYGSSWPCRAALAAAGHEGGQVLYLRQSLNDVAKTQRPTAAVAPAAVFARAARDDQVTAAVGPLYCPSICIVVLASMPYCLL